MAFVATANAAKARKFYRDTLGMRLLSEDSFALAFEVEGVMLRVQIVEKVAAAPYTALGWQVKDAAKTVKALQKAGVKFERYPGMGQDELGIWKSPAGARIAWFKDPDGNTLSIAEM
jgi:catechol 2,3-dioxygenase-like lactoylglutathione lyase family enzyme